MARKQAPKDKRRPMLSVCLSAVEKQLIRDVARQQDRTSSQWAKQVLIRAALDAYNGRTANG